MVDDRGSKDRQGAAADATSQALQEQIVAALRDRPEILEAYLFGSVARGTAAAHSGQDRARHRRSDRAG